MYIIAAVGILSLGYLIFAALCVEKFHRIRKDSFISPAFQPPVTIFKPVFGLGPEMRENLRSFCVQDYPEYQIIYGLHDENDPAISIIREIMADYPGQDIELVVDNRLHGSNYKVSNLVNMFGHAKHGILLIADDDMRVSGNYLNAVVSPFADHKIGAVTCLYSGSPRGGIVSSLNAMFVNEWFLPSVLISHALKNDKFCFGATMAVRREILEQIGGFDALVDYLADDYMLGKLVADHGHKIYLSHYVVENIIQEPDFKSMLLHELRWARTVRTVEPFGYAFSFLTDTLVISCFAGAATLVYTHQLLWPVLIISFVLLARILFHMRLKFVLNSGDAGSIWLVPVRDFLSFFIRLASFTGNEIEWKNKTFSVDNAGLIYAPGE